MSAFDSALASVNAPCLRVFGVPATLVPQDGSGSISITGIISKPAMDEPELPNSLKGVSVVRLWVDLNSIAREPEIGDTVQLNGVTYTLFQMATEFDGGASVLKLRRNA